MPSSQETSNFQQRSNQVRTQENGAGGTAASSRPSFAPAPQAGPARTPPHSDSMAPTKRLKNKVQVRVTSVKLPAKFPERPQQRAPRRRGRTRSCTSGMPVWSILLAWSSKELWLWMRSTCREWGCVISGKRNCIHASFLASVTVFMRHFWQV